MTERVGTDITLTAASPKGDFTINPGKSRKWLSGDFKQEAFLACFKKTKLAISVLKVETQR
jgi:hypothetical protein